ncbi:MAG: orotate phosphoribosyltransferase [Candidatus Methanomethylicia archaeon]
MSSWSIRRIELARRVSEILSETCSISFGEFKLTSGKVSPYYIDMRRIPGYPKAFREIVDVYVELIWNTVGVKGFDRIAGIPTAGIPYAVMVAYKLSKPFLYLRKEEKKHGLGKLVEGVMNRGDRILIIDDLITTGGSIINAARSIRLEEGSVSDVVVLIDREQGGSRNLKMENLNLHCLTTISELINFLREMKAISEEKYLEIAKYIEREKTIQYYK